MQNKNILHCRNQNLRTSFIFKGEENHSSEILQQSIDPAKSPEGRLNAAHLREDSFLYTKISKMTGLAQLPLEHEPEFPSAPLQELGPLHINAPKHEPWLEMSTNTVLKELKNALRFALLANAEDRYTPEQNIDTMRTVIGKAHDEAIDTKVRGYGDYLPDVAKKILDFVQRPVDSMGAEMLIDDADITHQELIEFIKLEKQIVEAKIALLEAKPKNEARNGEIAGLRKELSLYEELLVKAEDAIDLEHKEEARNNKREDDTAAKVADKKMDDDLNRLS